MIERSQILGAIIAGGLATRMGGVNKPLMMVGREPLIVHTFERLTPQVGATIVNANRNLDGIAATLPTNTAIVKDDADFTGRGPLIGLLACMSKAQAMNLPFIATAAADTPFFPKDLVDQLRAPTGEETIRVARHDGYRHPLFALWPTALGGALEAFLRKGETNKVMAFAQHHALIEVDIEASGDPFFNVNDQQDLQQANQMLQELQA
ncbi:MAG: molybdenum cofactor guanylyltransferase MobA [Pseudomonadota bacterium]